MERIKHVLQSPLGKRKAPASQNRVFGVPLDELVNHQENQSPAPQIPYIVDKICQYIFANGINQEGIFRVNGSSRVVEKLRDSFERHGDANLDSVDDVMAVAGLLKMFLRELPESVIPEAMTAKFVKVEEDCRGDKSKCLQALKLLLAELPALHYALLKYIIRFLVDVARNETNKMTHMGLAIVFGPNLFRCSSGIDGLRDQGVTNEIVRKFVSEYEDLFGSLDEPSPFDSQLNSQVRDGEKKKRVPPSRPPPPKYTDSVGNTMISSEQSEELRPTPSPKLAAEEFMERASPFTIVDGDGHSSIASPILSMVASELVTKTISEAVLEHIFSIPEIEARSVFDYWGCSDYDPDTIGETHTVNQHILSNGQGEYYNDGSAPRPKPRPQTAVSRENSIETSSSLVRMNVTAAEDSTDHSERPKPKPRIKSAHARLALSRSNEESRDTAIEAVALTNGDLSAVVEPKLVSQTNGRLSSISNHQEEAQSTPSRPSSATNHRENIDSFKELTSDITTLTHFIKPKGPARRAPSHHSISSRNRLSDGPSESERWSKHSDEPSESERRSKQSDEPSESERRSKQSDEPSESERRTNQSVRLRSPSDKTSIHSDKLTSQEPPQPITHMVELNNNELKATAPEEKIQTGFKIIDVTENTVPKLDLSQLSSSENVKELLAHEPQPDSPHNGAMDTPPLDRKQLTAEDEQRAAAVKQLNKKINVLKKKIKQFEDSFEAEYGHKPTTQDKNNKLEIKKAVAELAKARKELKQLKEKGTSETQQATESPANAAGSGDHPGSRPTSVVPAAPQNSEPATMADTLDVLLKRLQEKRLEAHRSEDLNAMNRDQVQEEKLAVQKALLHFESIHGRPQTKSEKELMRPLYDRYRQIKKVLASAPAAVAPSSMDKTKTLVDPTHPAAGDAAQSDPRVTNHTDGPRPSTARMNGDDEEHTDTPPGPTVHKTPKEPTLHDMQMHELKAELDRVNNDKKRLRKVLRDFEDEFQREARRKVQKEDRGPMANEYHEYKQIKAKIKLLEALLSKQD